MVLDLVLTSIRRNFAQKSRRVLPSVERIYLPGRRLPDHAATIPVRPETKFAPLVSCRSVPAPAAKYPLLKQDRRDGDRWLKP